MARRTSLSADLQDNIESRRVQGHASVHCKVLVSQHLNHVCSLLLLRQARGGRGCDQDIGIGTKMNFNWLRGHVHPQSSIELCWAIPLHESIELCNSRGEHCSLESRSIVDQRPFCLSLLRGWHMKMHCPCCEEPSELFLQAASGHPVNLGTPLIGA